MCSVIFYTRFYSDQSHPKIIKVITLDYVYIFSFLVYQLSINFGFANGFDLPMARESPYWQIIKEDILNTIDINIDTYEINRDTLLPVPNDYHNDRRTVTEVCLQAKCKSFSNGSAKNVAEFLMEKVRIPYTRREKQMEEYSLRLSYIRRYRLDTTPAFNDEISWANIVDEPLANNRKTDVIGHTILDINPPVKIIFEGKIQHDSRSINSAINQVVSISAATAENLNYTGYTYMVLLSPIKFYLGKFDGSKKRELQNIIFEEYHVFTQDQFRIYEWIRFFYDFQIIALDI